MKFKKESNCGVDLKLNNRQKGEESEREKKRKFYESHRKQM